MANEGSSPSGMWLVRHCVPVRHPQQQLPKKVGFESTPMNSLLVVISHLEKLVLLLLYFKLNIIGISYVSMLETEALESLVLPVSSQPSYREHRLGYKIDLG